MRYRELMPEIRVGQRTRMAIIACSGLLGKAVCGFEWLDGLRKGSCVTGRGADSAVRNGTASETGTPANDDAATQRPEASRPEDFFPRFRWLRPMAESNTVWPLPSMPPNDLLVRLRPFVRDDCVDPVPEPSLGPEPTASFALQEIGIQNAGVYRDSRCDISAFASMRIDAAPLHLRSRSSAPFFPSEYPALPSGSREYRSIAWRIVLRNRRRDRQVPWPAYRASHSSLFPP